MGTQPNIAQAIRDRGADYVLAVKDNQPTLAVSIEDFVCAFEAAPSKTPHQFHEVVEKDHGRLEVRRCHVFDPLDCLHAPERWPDLWITIDDNEAHYLKVLCDEVFGRRNFVSKRSVRSLSCFKERICLDRSLCRPRNLSESAYRNLGEEVRS
jgi:hypothetical protein